MTIYADLFGNTLEVRIIAGSRQEWDRDLGLLTETVEPQDRWFCCSRSAWVIDHWQSYAGTALMKAALEERRSQIEAIEQLFQAPQGEPGGAVRMQGDSYATHWQQRECELRQ